ncbi:DUF368 domain-containing protein [Microbacterium sp. C7(2022)]|uniref:DUF368 domain-containing protein n=1 Tax=Microbacterium sp. C7(2022) TaxID=2992759 RepID=UPI00237C2279|nr:DUF368 domain-containing protein [Microbacterium sp. C7(2022)]MDE0546174.1 DUF368 domain-containing protein [Microbacterium sp. C7(2022)]
MTTPPVTPPARATSPARTLGSALFDALRGALIGLAELLPGISGGTVALITGVYERLISAVAHVLSAVTALVRGPERRAGFAKEMRAVEWMLVVPVLVGMAAMVLTLAGPIEALVSGNPELARGLFFGLVAASVFVPILLIPRARRTIGAHIAGVAVFVAFAALAFVLTALSGSATDAEPSLWVVFFAAAIAVCALVVPGVSGSFFLLAIGLYSPTLVAVDERDLGYLGVFALGALVGLATIVRLMKWLLAHHRRYTLLAMAGLMLGSLRALWPWQAVPTGDAHGVGEPVAPYDPILGPILCAVLGAAVVVVMLVVERVLIARRALGEPVGAQPAHS